MTLQCQLHQWPQFALLCAPCPCPTTSRELPGTSVLQEQPLVSLHQPRLRCCISESSVPSCARCLQQCPTHKHSLHHHKSSSTALWDGIRRFGLCEHRAEGSAALFAGRSMMLQHHQHFSPAPTCPAARSNPLPSLPFPSWHNL